MKKKMLFVIATIVAFALFVPNALAAEVEVSTATELTECVKNVNNQCVLKADISLSNVELSSGYVDIPAGKTLTLSGNSKIYGNATLKINGLIVVKSGVLDASGLNFSAEKGLIPNQTGKINVEADGTFIGLDIWNTMLASQGGWSPIKDDHIFGECEVGSVVLSDNRTYVYAEEDWKGAIQVGDKHYDTLAAAIDNAPNGGTVKLNADINLDSIISIAKDITIDGGNKKITSAKNKIFEISGSADNSTVVTIKDVTMEMSKSGARCVDTRTGSVELTLDGVNLKTTSAGNNQPITIGNTYADGEKNNIINLVDTTIEAGKAGYAIIVFNPINLTIDNSSLNGYASLYMKGAVFGAKGSADSVITVKKSTLSATSNKGEAFGTVVFEDNDITVNVIDSTITANTVENSSFSVFKWNALNGQYKPGNTEAIEEIEGNKITVSGKSEIKTSGVGTAQIAKTGSENTVVIDTGVTSDLEVPSDYLPEGTKTEEDKDGNIVVVPDTVVLTLTGVYDDEIIPDAKAEIKDIIRNYIFSGEDIKKLNELVESINDELKDDGLLFKGFYTDKEGTKKVDLTKAISDNTTWYMIFADAVRTQDGEYIFKEEAIAISSYVIENGKNIEDREAIAYFKKGSKLSEEFLENLEKLEEEINKAYKDKGLVYIGVFHDKEGTKKVDFTKVLNEDAEWYLVIGEKEEEPTVQPEEPKGEEPTVKPEEPKEELPPKTGDLNLAILIGTILVGTAGAVIISKKRFAKSN